MAKTELEVLPVSGESVAPDGEAAVSQPHHQSSATRITRILFLVLILLVILSLLPGGSLAFLDSRLQTFSTIFLGIFIEAVPFLLIGSLVSGLIAVFMDRETLMRFIPRRTVPAAMTGALLGIVFPVCECGVVPVTRRLYQKGLPISVGIAFLLSAPVINPIVAASTFVAFGWGPILIGRYVLTFVIAFLVGLVFHFAKPEEIILPAEMTGIGLPESHHGPSAAEPGIGRVWQAVVTAADDFLDMSRYLIIGSLLAAGMQTFISQSTLIQFGQGQVLSVVALMTLAFVLSICSTVDAFLALSFASTFTTGSILGFLVFGPMVDIKSALMFLGVFRRRVVLYLILLPMLFTLLFALIVNLYLGL
jgi:uncharacterized protein